MSKPLVLFHDACMDGLTAAWLMWRRHFERADYQAVRYGEPPPDVCDRYVYVLDFSYPPDVMLKMALDAKRVICLDHHKSAIERDADWDHMKHCNVELHFDMTQSGAMLTNQYLNALRSLWIVDYVQDRDLWAWKLPHSREINAYLAASVMGLDTVEAFHKLNDIRAESLKEVTQRGIGARMQIDAYVRQVSKEAHFVQFDGAKVPVVNVSRPFTSDVLNELAKGKPFALGWREEGEKLVFSLRSTEESSTDVSLIAKKFGGGGHRNAAGFVRNRGEDVAGLLPAA